MRNTKFLTAFLLSWLSFGYGDDRQLQSNTPRVIAEAYECDEYLEMLSDEQRKAYKPVGYEIRVCVRPVTPTRNRGIVMRTLDDFTWYRSYGSTVQPAILNKADQPRTIQVCIPGRVICSFKTKLLDDFFYGETNGTVVGSGTVSMQVEGDDDNPEIRRRLGADSNGIFQTEIEWITNRNLQVGSALGGYAGSSGVTVEFNVDRQAPPDDFVPYTEDDITSWWEDSPTWLKALVILGAIIVFLMGCCLCCMCLWSIRESMKDRNDEERKAKELEEDEAQQEQAPNVVVMNPVNGDAASPWDLYEPSESEEPTSGVQPTDNDVCFDADQHPGTKAMHKAVKKTLKKYPTEEYSPEIYRHIKNQLSGRKFFVCDDENNPDVWREVQKNELAELLQKEFEDLRQKQDPSTSMVVID